MARRSVLNRSFSTSEKVLMLVLAVLLVVACYYFLVVKNVADTIAANEDRLADIEISINAQEMLAADRARMKAELEALGEDGTLPVVAVYDNIRVPLRDHRLLRDRRHVGRRYRGQRRCCADCHLSGNHERRRNHRRPR